MKLKVLAAVLVLLIASLACSVGGGEEPGVLFRDDFSNDNSGWDVYADEIATLDYVNDEYRIQVNEVQYDVWAYPGKSYTNVDITVEARKEAGPDDNNFGIICRAVSDNEFYMGLIASDGYYVIQKLVNGDYERLSGEYFDYSDDINQGSATNTIRLTCIDDTITLYANGVELTSVQDTQFSTGDVGLLAGTFETAGVEIRFDNFVVREP
jgi:hypothetical protein